MGTRAFRAAWWVAALVSSLGLGPIETSAGDRSPSWATGPALRQQLASPVGVLWSGVPLRRAITNVCASRRVAVLLDRRVDPDQKLTVQRSDMPLEQLLGQIADEHDLALSVLSGMVYVGPPEAASRLRTLVQLRQDEVRRLSSTAARKFSQIERLRWDDFATPGQLLVQLAEDGGIRLDGLKLIPHDLWAAADLPPLTLVERLTLLAIQFDLTFTVSENGATATLVPVPEQVVLDREYPGGRDPQALARQWSEAVPEARIKVLGAKILVRGTVEDHEQIAVPSHADEQTASKGDGDSWSRRGKRPGGTRHSAATEQRFTVKETRGPVGSLATELAGKLGLELRFDQKGIEEAGISLNQQITFSVKDATVDELLRAVLAPARLSFRRSGKVVEVYCGR